MRNLNLNFVNQSNSLKPYVIADDIHNIFNYPTDEQSWIKRYSVFLIISENSLGLIKFSLKNAITCFCFLHGHYVYFVLFV